MFIMFSSPHSPFLAKLHAPSFKHPLSPTSGVSEFRRNLDIICMQIIGDIAELAGKRKGIETLLGYPLYLTHSALSYKTTMFLLLF